MYRSAACIRAPLVRLHRNLLVQLNSFWNLIVQWHCADRVTVFWKGLGLVFVSHKITGFRSSLSRVRAKRLYNKRVRTLVGITCTLTSVSQDSSGGWYESLGRMTRGLFKKLLRMFGHKPVWTGKKTPRPLCKPLNCGFLLSFSLFFRKGLRT